MTTNSLDTSAEPTLTLEEYLGIEKSKALSGLTPTLLVGVFMASTITVLVFSMHFSVTKLLLWLLSVFVMVTSRWWTTKKIVSRHANKDDYQQHLNLFTFWSFLTGLNWGALAFLFYDPDVPIYSIYLVSMLAGYISVVGASGAPHLPGFLAFSVPTVLLVFMRFVTAGSGLFLALAAASIVYLLVMTLLTRVMNQNFIFAKKLEYENQFLLNQVTEQKNRAETAVVEKNNFLAATSHDLRQPLHAMNLYIDALQARLIDPLDINILEKIALSGSALNDLLHGLLDISRLDASVVENRPQHIKLISLANYLVDEFSAQAIESDLQLIIDVDDQHIVYADPILLERILRNLISNAIKYTEKGRVELSTTIVGSTIHISVNDTGIGVPEERLTDVFSEFIQVGNSERDRSRGLGLGLSIVKRLCDLQEIELIFQSQLGKGTQVRLTVTQGDAALLPMVKPSASEGIDFLNILCIDDEEHIRDGMQMIVDSWRCQAIIASDGRSALEAVRKLDEPVDIIISDLRLRDQESGLSVIQAIRQELNQQVPAIIVTGDTSVDRIELVRDAQDVNLIHKPIKPADLRQAVEHILKNYQDNDT